MEPPTPALDIDHSARPNSKAAILPKGLPMALIASPCGPWANSAALGRPCSPAAPEADQCDESWARLPKRDMASSR